MASDSAPSSLFLRLTSIWGHLALRSDIDDIILELLGHFSLEKVYAGTGPGERQAYQQLVRILLSQLNVIFYLQRLTLPAENSHVSWYLGFLVSWELALRTVEFVLQVINEGRESLWDDRPLRDRYLAEFLLSALRFLSLHPKATANQRARERRERFSRIHRSLEQVFDSYPGPKSFLLEVCKEVTNRLHNDPDTLGLPSKMRYEVPNLTSELVYLPPTPSSCSVPRLIFRSILCPIACLHITSRNWSLLVVLVLIGFPSFWSYEISRISLLVPLSNMPPTESHATPVFGPLQADLEMRSFKHLTACAYLHVSRRLKW